MAWQSSRRFAGVASVPTNRLSTAACVALLGASIMAAGCPTEQQSDAPRRGVAVPLDRLSLAEAEQEPVKGQVAGRDFVTKEARYIIERHSKRERVDLIFSSSAMPHCGVPVRDDGQRVWIRFDGITRLEPGEHRLSPDDDGDVTVHYETDEEGRFTGVEGVAALLSIEEVELGVATGRVSVCFDDGRESCVKGRFRASECPTKLGVDLVGERHTKATSTGEEESGEDESPPEN